MENESLRSLANKGEMMKRKVFGIALGGCVIAIAAVATAFAQMPGEPIRATIPFDFTVQGRTLPAGTYEIRRISGEAGDLEIANLTDHHDHVFFETESKQTLRAPKRGELVFHRYGDTYFLSQVWTPGLETGRELTTSRQERTLKREMASNGLQSEPDTVAVTLN
jgi:hypothetical protein